MRLLRWLFGRNRRDIFRYWNGVQWLYADPLYLLRDLEDAGEWQGLIQKAVTALSVDPNKLSPALRAQVADKAGLVGELAEVVRDSFQVPPVGVGDDPRGLTDLECVHLLADFLVWCTKAGRDFRPLLNLPARPANSPEDSDTGEYAVSTSIDTSSDGSSP